MPSIERDTLYIAVSQSGETFDTLAAVQEIKRKGGRILGVVNVVGSTIARECGRRHLSPCRAGGRRRLDQDLHLHARWRWRCWRIHLGRLRDLSVANGARLIAALQALPDHIAAILEREPEIARLAEALRGRRARLLSSAAPPATPSPAKAR